MEGKDTFSMSFFVKRNRLNDKGEVPIYMRINANGKQIEMSLHRKIEDVLWCPSKGAAASKSMKARQINDHISSVQATIYDHYKRLRENGKEISPVAIKNAYLGVEEDRRSLVNVFKEHNNKMLALVGSEYSDGTHERYEVSLRHIQSFLKKKHQREDISLTQINHEFVTDFEFYLKADCRCSHNTTMKYVKSLKKVIRIAKSNGWMASDPFANYRISIKKVDKAFLDDNELNTLINKEFKIQRLDVIKDCFLFSCFTGLAYADLKALTQDNIATGDDGKLWVFTARKKTSNKSNIPILPPAKRILDKYAKHPHCQDKGVLLPVPSNQKMNAYLKEIADLCGIKKDLSSHTARHTFATTVTLNNDVPIETVSKMLGHSSIRMTQIYARLLDKKVGQDMGKLHGKY